MREGELWELLRRGREPLLHVTLGGPEPCPLDDAPRYMRLACLETGAVIHRAMWVFEEGNEGLKSSPATQQWRRVA